MPAPSCLVVAFYRPSPRSDHFSPYTGKRRRTTPRPPMSEPTTPTPRPAGLTSAEVAERVARGLTNRVRRSDLAEYADIVGRNVFTLFNALVLPAAVALFLLADSWSLRDDDNFKAAV